MNSVPEITLTAYLVELLKPYADSPEFDYCVSKALIELRCFSDKKNNRVIVNDMVCED